MICACRSSALSRARAAAVRSRRSRQPGGPTCRGGSVRTSPTITQPPISGGFRSWRWDSARLPGSARREEFLFEAIPRDKRKVYKMRPIIDALVDKGSFFEMGRMFGRPIITGFARVDGLPVALMASDPFFYGGAWTADACDKIIRFVDLAETFHLPIVYLCDCPGFHVGIEAEKAATIRKGVRAMAAV